MRKADMKVVRKVVRKVAQKETLKVECWVETLGMKSVALTGGLMG